MEYIEKFESVEQIKECAKYYIEILGLQDWKIKFKFGVPSNPDFAGECESIHEEKCACITIDNRDTNDLWFKQPQELVLIHELIHCKIILMENDTVEGKLLYQYYHTLVDDWARSVFFTRYSITQKDLYFEEDK